MESAAHQEWRVPLTPAGCRLTQVLLALTDNWQQTGGADEMVKWAGESPGGVLLLLAPHMQV